MLDGTEGGWSLRVKNCVSTTTVGDGCGTSKTSTPDGTMTITVEIEGLDGAVTYVYLVLNNMKGRETVRHTVIRITLSYEDVRGVQ